VKLRLLISPALVVAVATGCATVITKAPRDITLDLSEVPAGFRMTLDQENTAQSLASGFADPADKEAKFQQNGFSGSWRREYDRDAANGPTFIRSGATKFRDAAGASFGVTTNVNETAGRALAVTKLSLPERIGDESHAFEFAEVIGGREFTTYAIYFRNANVSNVMVVSGPVGTVDRAVAIDLAKRQVAKAKQ
jgi:hypothetical protein